MRKSSSFLLPQLRPRHKIPLNLLSGGDSFSRLHALPSSPTLAPNGSESNMMKNGYLCRKFSTHVNKPSDFDRIRKELASLISRSPEEFRSILQKAFAPDRSRVRFCFQQSLDQRGIPETFKEVEAVYDGEELGYYLLQLARRLDWKGEDPEMALSMLHKALGVFETVNTLPVYRACTLSSLGSVYLSLKRFDDSLEYFNRAVELFNSLKESGGSMASPFRGFGRLNDDVCFWEALNFAQYGMFDVKTKMGRREEAINHIREAMETREMLVKEGLETYSTLQFAPPYLTNGMEPESSSAFLGFANRDVAEAYVSVSIFEEASPFCLKALSIFRCAS